MQAFLRVHLEKDRLLSPLYPPNLSVNSTIKLVMACTLIQGRHMQMMSNLLNSKNHLIRYGEGSKLRSRRSPRIEGQYYGLDLQRGYNSNLSQDGLHSIIVLICRGDDTCRVRNNLIQLTHMLRNLYWAQYSRDRILGRSSKALRIYQYQVLQVEG